MSRVKLRVWLVSSVIATHFNLVYGIRPTHELGYDGFVVTDEYHRELADSHGLTLSPASAKNGPLSTSKAIKVEAENDELVYLGCYEYWSDLLHYNEDFYNYSYLEPPSPSACRTDCKVSTYISIKVQAQFFIKYARK